MNTSRRQFLRTAAVSLPSLPALSSLASGAEPVITAEPAARADAATVPGHAKRSQLKLGTVTFRLAMDWDIPTEYPFRKLFARLTDAGFAGYCLAEIPESSDAVRLMKYYRALFLAYQGLL